ncbi:hypothetical protein BDW67DRAFT_24833 [Aspergillus spinulosporus]
MTFHWTTRLCTETDSLACSVCSPSHTRPATSVDPSSSIRTQRSTFPYRVKASLASTTPRITYLYEPPEPIPDATKEVLAYLVRDDNTREPAEEGIAKLLQVSRRFTVDMCNAGSWLIDSVQPFLETAIGNLPLEA